MIQKCKFQKRNDPPICVETILSKNASSKQEMIHQFVSFLFWNLHFWIIFLLKLVDQYGALYLHYVLLLLLPIGSSHVCMDGPGNCGSFC